MYIYIYIYNNLNKIFIKKNKSLILPNKLNEWQSHKLAFSIILLK